MKIPSETFHLSVLSRAGMVYNGKVSALSSLNDKGPFDVLSRHSNFISIIHTKLAFRTIDGEDKEMEIDNAVMHVLNNEVKVYLGVRTSKKSDS